MHPGLSGRSLNTLTRALMQEAEGDVTAEEEEKTTGPQRQRLE